MSFFKLGFDGIQEVFMLALMLLFFIVIFYSNIDLMYKVGIGALVFTLIFISSMASQALKQQKEEAKKRVQ
ncbi:MAG: hypothetical protein NWF04_06880 [Candidatus Bathyarchaeota archaeon]|nr:hypothetical protein [Candidatus Bathyarchaeota archaeon]